MGVVTNRKESGPAFENDLEKMGMLKYFNTSHIANSTSLNLKKPDPQIFLYILGPLGVRPEETVMVGNSLHTDISGEKKAGISAIWRPMNDLHAELQEELGPGDHYLALLDKARTHEGEYYGKKGIMETNLVLPDAMIKDTSDMLDILQKTASTMFAVPLRKTFKRPEG